MVGAPSPSPAALLETYRKKRRFDETTEPRGRARAKASGLYVIQKHDASRLHYDFRLELDGVLKSWAVTRGPSLDPREKRLAVRTEDHPVDYGAFEGTIPPGNYGAGTVMLWDKGTWSPVGDPRDGLARGKLVFALRGKRLKGRWALIRMRNKGREKHESWLLIKEADEAALRGTDVLDRFKSSVSTGRALDDIAKAGNAKWISNHTVPKKKARARKAAHGPPDFVEPELATLVDAMPPGTGWLFEIKFDGYRGLIAASGDEVRILTRKGLDWSARFPSIARAVSALALDGVLIDGEIVVVDEQGRSDFSALQKALKVGKDDFSYFAFDLLAEQGRSLRDLPLHARKARLKALLGEKGSRGPIFYSEEFSADGTAVYAEFCRRGFEGVLAKRADSRYRSGRARDWLKIKCGRAQEFVIGGWSPSTRSRAFSSLLLGVQETSGLRYAGRVGTGFDATELDDLMARFRTLARNSAPFTPVPPRTVARQAHWVEPKLVAEIAFAGFTHDGLIRQGRYIGLREDKPAREVTREKAEPVKQVVNNKTGAVVGGVTLSHPEKILFEGAKLTKLDLARYYEKVAPVMMPIIAERLISVVRCPDGESKECFFQRHTSPGAPAGFKSIDIPAKNGGKKRESYFYLTGEQALIAAAQFGVLEIHGWGARIDAPDKPDRIVFDLDPAPDVPFERVSEAAFSLRDALEVLGLTSFATLTGGKGIHVIAPILRKAAWPIVKAFTRQLAEHFAASQPAAFIAVASKAKRNGKIFIDYLRNDWSATAIQPFSPRAQPEASIAYPLAWDSLSEETSAKAVTIADILAGRRALGAWPDFAKQRQSLTEAALKGVARL